MASLPRTPPAWHKILYEKGWVAPHWPKEVGGTGWDAARRFIFNEEMELAGAPQLSVFGLSMVGPLIISFGTDEQKKRFLPKILERRGVLVSGVFRAGLGERLSRRSGRPRRMLATTSSSTDKRRGPPTRSTPIGSSVSFGPTQT